jgi:hypothetical protein
VAPAPLPSRSRPRVTDLGVAERARGFGLCAAGLPGPRSLRTGNRSGHRARRAELLLVVGHDILDQRPQVWWETQRSRRLEHVHRQPRAGTDVVRDAGLEHLLEPLGRPGHAGKHTGQINAYREPSPPHAANERRAHRGTGPVARRHLTGAQEAAIGRRVWPLNGEERLARPRLGPLQPEIERDPLRRGGRRTCRTHATEQHPQQQTLREPHGEKIPVCAHRVRRHASLNTC